MTQSDGATGPLAGPAAAPRRIRIRAGRHAGLIGGCILLGLLALLIFGASFITPYDPLEQRIAERLQPPGLEHPLGTDRFGRDVLARTLHGGQYTLIASAAALGGALGIGLLIGLGAGMMHGTWIDALLMRIIDVLMSFPFMVLALVVAALLGTSLLHLLLAVVAVWWVAFARLARSVALQARQETSYAAARVLGASRIALLVKELLPRALGPVLILATFELGSLILSIAALSFLGLGAQPPAPEWGSMLADGRAHMLQAPHILAGPALFIVLTVLAFNLIGEGLRDRLDPYEQPGWQ
ncbi:ABC transporter permease [Paenibacillus sp. IB182496]|uniref:ABC transporter permease n=1 Tax=Paenibacillus sabuli TaxID=2772509 RepID=A0A927BVM7_9BACL|nr:ABC transporter permease [Paenibacillus sabuli]MBD2847677.1 ABC transporter permease [Paenibacillus sabuli]